MNLTEEEILRYAAAGNQVCFRSDGSVSSIRPVTSVTEKVTALSAAQRAKRYRDRHKIVTDGVTPEPGTVTNVTMSQCHGSPAPSPLHPPSPPPPAKAKRARPRFLAPTLPEWTAYGLTLLPPFPEIEAARAWNHYEGNGWRVGKNPAKNWQACLRTCYLGWKRDSHGPNGKPNHSIPRNQRDPVYSPAPVMQIVPESDRPTIADIQAAKSDLRSHE